MPKLSAMLCTANGPKSKLSPFCGVPLFKFGIITDVQYGDIEDRLNYDGTVMRYYRDSANLLKQAIRTWADDGKDIPDFVLQLGDLIEGCRVDFKDRERNLEHVLDCCAELKCYFCHLWGNHELNLFSREELAKSRLNSKPKMMCEDTRVESSQNGTIISVNAQNRSRTHESAAREYYFTFSPHRNFKFIALDSYDISICGRKSDEPEYKMAEEILTKHNHHSDWNNPIGLKKRYFVKFNGGLGQRQLNWLEKELEMAEKSDQNVFIMSHVPIHPDCTSDFCLVWNYEEVLDVIQRYSCVKVCFYGHTHEGKQCVDTTGIHHITYPAVLECKADENAFVTALVYENKLELIGHGVIKSMIIDF